MRGGKEGWKEGGGGEGGRNEGKKERGKGGRKEGRKEECRERREGGKERGEREGSNFLISPTIAHPNHFKVQLFRTGAKEPNRFFSTHTLPVVFRTS